VASLYTPSFTKPSIAAGADVVLQQLTFGELFQPVNLQIVGQEDFPEFCEATR
jgi:hypothetical protein